MPWLVVAATLAAIPAGSGLSTASDNTSDVPVTLVAAHRTGHGRAPIHIPGAVGGGFGGGFGGGVGGGFFWFGPPYYVTIDADGRPIMFGPQPLSFFPPFLPVPAPVRGPLGGPMPFDPRPAAAPVGRNARPADPAQADKMVTLGDRLFRAGNFKKAEERYEQAKRLNPGEASPRVRLAQIALVRGRYSEAADRLRDAISVQPGWLSRAPDIRSIYGEPSEFQRPIARLESHLLAQPSDRDGWLVLGAELYLSGQTRRAADVFLRLTDRTPDPALAAFLDASQARPQGQE